MIASPFGGVRPLGGDARTRRPRGMQPPTTPMPGMPSLPPGMPEVPPGGVLPPLELGDTTPGGMATPGAPFSEFAPSVPASRGGTQYAPPVSASAGGMGMSGMAGAPGARPMSPVPGLSTFGPGNDLRSTQINPTDSRATQRANRLAGAALGNYAGFSATPFSGVAAGSYTPGGDTTASRAALMAAMQSLSSLPDRTALATGNMRLLNEVNAEQDAQDIRRIGQSAAKFGRIGSGLTTTNLGDLGERGQINRGRASQQLALDAASGQAADAIGRVGAIGGVTSLLGGEDRGNAGVSLGLRNEARGERGDRFAYDAADFARRGQLFGDVATYAANREGVDASRRAELRGERAYQGGMENQAYDRQRQAIGDAGAQTDAARRSAFGLIGAGSGGPDLSALLTGAGQSQQAQGAQGMDALMRYILSQYGGR